MHTTLSATPTTRGPDFSIVIPCFNERDNVLALVREIAQTCAGRHFEILVVDDASTDGSGEHLLGAAGEFDSRLRLVRHAHNRGQSASVCTGIDFAQGRCIVTLDGDGQNAPRDIPALLPALAACDVPTIVPLLVGTSQAPLPTLPVFQYFAKNYFTKTLHSPRTVGLVVHPELLVF